VAGCAVRVEFQVVGAPISPVNESSRVSRPPANLHRGRRACRVQEDIARHHVARINLQMNRSALAGIELRAGAARRIPGAGPRNRRRRREIPHVPCPARRGETAAPRAAFLPYLDSGIDSRG
jgi:hypothetical protein